MSFAKELLFSCVVMMHVSFVVMGPLGKQSICKSLEKLGLPLGNLRLAEKNYVKLIFNGSAPMHYRLNTWHRSENITFGNSTEEIQASVCAIIDYLGNHLPNITKNLTDQFHPIINNTTHFLHEFKIAVKPNVEVKKCEKRAIETSHGYAMKEMGLRFLYSSRRWVEHFTKIDC